MTQTRFAQTCHGPHLERIVIGVFRLDNHLHADKGIPVAQIVDIFILQPDATFTGTARNALAVVGAAVDADAPVACSYIQTQKPCTIGKDVAATVTEIVPPGRGVAYLLNLEKGNS